MFKRQHQYSSLFSRFEVDQHKVCEYNNRALPPSCLPRLLFLPGLPPPFLHTASDQNWRWELPENEAKFLSVNLLGFCWKVNLETSCLLPRPLPDLIWQPSLLDEFWGCPGNKPKKREGLGLSHPKYSYG